MNDYFLCAGAGPNMKVYVLFSMRWEERLLFNWKGSPGILSDSIHGLSP